MKGTVVCILLAVFCFTGIMHAQKFASKADSLSALIKTDADDTNKVNHLCDLAKELMFVNTDTAITLASKSLELSTNILSSNESQKNKNVKLAAQKGMAKSYASIGAFYYVKGEYALSLENQFKAVEIREAIGDKSMLANSYNNIGIVFRNQGDHTRALEFYTKAYNINTEIGDKTRAAQNINNIGLVYNDQREFDKALEYFQKALNLNEGMNNKITAASNMNNIGIVYYELRNYTKALEYYQKAMVINEKEGNYPEMANNLANIGAAYDKQKNYEMALKNYLDALDINQQLGNQYGVALNMGNAGGIYVEQKKFSDAKNYLTKALSIAEEIQAWQLIQDHNLTLSNLYSATGDYKSAYEHYQKYSAAKDTLFNDSKSKDLGRLEMKHEIEQAEKERIRAEEEKTRIAKKERERKNTLQYSGMFLALVLIALIVVLLGFVKVSPAMARSVTFFSFLLVFEFLLLFTDPWLDKFSGGEPVYKLILNVLLALLIFPINAALENALKKRLVKRGAEKELK